MVIRILISAAVFLWLSGCGGAQPSAQTAEEGVGLPDNNGSAETAKKAKPDKKAEEAKAFCEHEIKKSSVKPVELLNKKQISACLIALRPAINAQCAKGVEREIVLKIIVGNEGTVVGAFPVGDGADSEEASCVAKLVRPAAFPAFTGKEQQVIEKYPFKIQP